MRILSAGEKGQRTGSPMAFLLMMTFVVLLIPGRCLGQSDTLTGMDEEDFIHKYKSANKTFETKCKKHLLKGNLKKAEKGLRKCQEILPGHVGSLFFLSQVLYQKEDYTGALAYIRKARENYKIFAKRMLGIQKRSAQLLQARKKELREVIDSFRGFESIDGSCGTNSVIGQITNEIHSIEGKEPLPQEMEELEQVPADYFYIHGNILFKLKQYRAARDQYIEAVKINPMHRNAYNNIASLYYTAGDYKKALFYLELAEKNGVAVNTELKDRVLLSLSRPAAPDAPDAPVETMPEGTARFVVTVGEAPHTSEQNTYIAFNPRTRDAVIIDPGVSDKRIETFIQSRELKIRRILNTHGHYDHIGGNRYYADLYNVDITASTADAPFYTGKNGVNRPTRFLGGEGPLDIPGLEITVFFTPGHSPGSVSYLIDGRLFSGDTLFKEGVGRTWGETDEEQQEKMDRQLSHIKSKLLTLPPATRVFPGHGPDTVIEWENNNNPFL